MSYSDKELKRAVKKAKSIYEVCRILNCRNSHKFVKNKIRELNINISHFLPRMELALRALEKFRRGNTIALKDILVKDSSYSNRATLKNRLYKKGIKHKKCELCGQGEIWHGKKMSLILDHINGVNNDNRLENLRIVCPNCAATLETHCGKNLRKPCQNCGGKRDSKNPLCSICREIKKIKIYKNRIKTRKVFRPPYEQLLSEIKNLGYRATGRKYNVSDVSIRKWIRWYEKERRSGDLLSMPQAGVEPADDADLESTARPLSF